MKTKNQSMRNANDQAIQVNNQSLEKHVKTAVTMNYDRKRDLELSRELKKVFFKERFF